MDNPMTSRKSLKQLQQLKRSQMKFDPDSQQSTSLGQEDNSTQNSNNLDQNSKKRRTTSGGASFYMNSNSGQYNENGWATPSPWAVYQADLYGFCDKPKWFPVWYKLNKSLVQKIRAFSYGGQIQLSTIQSSMSLKLTMRLTQGTSCEKLRLQTLSFSLLRNLLRIQNFCRSILKMKNDAAMKIQKTRRLLRSQRYMNAELEQKVDQLQYYNSVRIIQTWFKGKIKLIKAKRSKVNPAVE